MSVTYEMFADGYTGVGTAFLSTPARTDQQFTDGYKGMTWMQSVYMLARDFWSSLQASPYKGQLYPPSGGSTPAQLYPY